MTLAFHYEILRLVDNMYLWLTRRHWHYNKVMMIMMNDDAYETDQALLL